MHLRRVPDSLEQVDLPGDVSGLRRVGELKCASAHALEVHLHRLPGQGHGPLGQSGAQGAERGRAVQWEAGHGTHGPVERA